jgi:NADPH-dependent 2,4-dienoyl-CoA reductase/sulfur reductase-like enzyme
METSDLIIIGAGPAGMAAAIEARQSGLNVLVLDEQPAPGGQIWRGIERNGDGRTAKILGAAYQAGKGVVQAFRASGASYLPCAQVWNIDAEPGHFVVFANYRDAARSFSARHVLLATGAHERPVPFEGWTLPGVMTVGAAQIMLKSARQIPDAPIWVVGSGPLPLLYMTQLIAAGGKIGGYIDTTPDDAMRRALPALVRNAALLKGAGDLLKGLAWQNQVRRSGAVEVRGGRLLAALGKDRLVGLHFRDAEGQSHRVSATHLIVHEGIVPSIHIPLSLRCEMEWNHRNACLQPRTDAWGELSQSRLFTAGDGAAIGGAEAARHYGRLAAMRIVQQVRATSDQILEGKARPVRAALENARILRPFIEVMYEPRQSTERLPDEVILCRCENVTVGTVRALAAEGASDPNQIKAFTRCGMGPCQGRQCNYTVSRVIAETYALSADRVGLFRVRPPLKPLSLGQLAQLSEASNGAS